MRKDTALQRLKTMENQIPKGEKTLEQQEGQRAAIANCRKWLENSTWATLREPLNKRRSTVNAQLAELKATAKQRELTEDEIKERSKLAGEASIYRAFDSVIASECLQAEVDAKIRADRRSQ